MKHKFFILVLVLMTSGYASAHSGRTDSSGGHNCSYKSTQKGLCSGYHYHNRRSENQYNITLASNNSGKLYKKSECIGSVVAGKCHGNIIDTNPARLKCHGEMLGGSCTGPQF